MLLDEVSKLLVELRLPTALAITPDNLEAEKSKFLASSIYSPQFKYVKRPNQNEKIFSELKSLVRVSDVDPRISEFYIQLISDKKDADDLMDSIGQNEAFTVMSKRHYKVPTEKLFRNACLVLKRKVKKYQLAEDRGSKENLHFDQIKKAIEIVLAELGLTEWGVKESMNIAKNGLKTGTKGKTIFLDRNIEKTPFLVKKSIVHEVGTHVLRSHNGALSGVPALYNANVKSYLDIEEGLAMYNEEMMGVLDYQNLMKRALMVYGVYVGEKLSFRNLYEVLRGFTKPLDAFDVAYRLKRGLGDTNQPGIYSKDVSYFRGFRRVRQAIEKDQSLYAKLYAGKIDLKKVSWVDEGLIPSAQIVPTKELLEKALVKAGL